MDMDKNDAIDLVKKVIHKYNVKPSELFTREEIEQNKYLQRLVEKYKKMAFNNSRVIDMDGNWKDLSDLKDNDFIPGPDHVPDPRPKK